MTNGRRSSRFSALSQKIMVRIEQEERRARRRNAFFFGTLLALSAAFMAFGVVNLMNALASSGFLRFSALFFSDFSFIARDLPDFLASIAASAPIFSFAIFFAGLFFSLWSAGRLSHEIS